MCSSKLKRSLNMILVACILIQSIVINAYPMANPAMAEGVSSFEVDYRSLISYELEENIYADYDTSHSTVVKFKLNNPATQDISFDYKIYSGSGSNEHFSAIEEGTIIFAAGETEKSLDIEVYRLVNNPVEFGNISNPSQFWTKDRVFYVNCSNIENALFYNEKPNMTIPIRIQNQLDLTESYNNAKETYLVDLSKLTDVEEFPESPGKYFNNSDTMYIANDTKIEGDLRTIIDLGVFSHINLPIGFFHNENEAPENPEDPETIGDVSFIIGTDFIDRISFSKNISILNNNITDFNLGTIEIEEINLGPAREPNVMISSIYSHFDYSTVTEAVYTYFNDANNNYIEKQINFIDIINPYVKEISSPSDTFYYGENIPITIEYNEPVLVDDISIKVNDRILYPVERDGTISNEVSFLLEIEDKDDFILIDGFPSYIEVTDVIGAIDLAGNPQDEAYSTQLFESTFASFDPAKSLVYFANTNINIINNGMEPKGEVIISIADNYDLTSWLGANTNGDGVIPNIKARVIGNDGDPTFVDLYYHESHLGNELRGEFNPPQNLSDENNYYITEIYFKENVTDEIKLVYPLLKEYTILPIIYIDDPSDLEILYTNWPSTNRISADNEDLISLNYNVKNNATWQDSTDFQWSSKDESIATITNNGNILLTGKIGIVEFTLTALNGGISGKEFSIHSKTLEVLNPSTTFLTIPSSGKNIEITKGNNAIVYYATNIVENNELYGGNGTKTRFNYNLYEAKYIDENLIKGDLVHTESLDATTNENLTSYTINNEYLVNTSKLGKFSYILEISSTELATGRILSAAANIAVKYPNVKAILYKPTNFYTTDEHNYIDARFKIDNFNEETQFDLSITKNSEDVPFFTTTNPADINIELPINIDSVERSRLVDIYTIVLKAKNESSETFSYDSYILYVYNSNALKIMAGDRHIDTLYLNNNHMFSTMTSEEILALNRKITLRENISINNKEYKWSSLADKIVWQVEDNNKISLKYNDSGVYKEIDNSNIGFLPGLEFLLEGVSSGNTSITATHSLTGMKTSLNVEIDKSEDKLFIFQVYPAQEARVYYTNGDNQNKSQKTDEKGRIAIYEENDISSSVTFTPKDTNLYEPVVISNSQIKANQKSTNEFGLYPQTIVNFSPVQYKAAIKLYNRDTNITYLGDIKIKGGVYRNGVYCPDAKINGVSGKLEQTISKNEFEFFALNFNPNEFINKTDTSSITVKDNIEYVIEVTFPDGSYFPVIIKIDNDTIRQSKFIPYGAIAYKSIEKINTNNFSDNMIFYQTININGKVEGVDGAINIIEKADSAIFTMEMAIEGDKKKNYDIQLTDERNNSTLVAETTQYSYEFTDTILVKSDFHMEDYLKGLKDLDKVRMYLKLKISDNTSTKEIKLSDSLIVNTLIDVPKMDDYLVEEIEDIAGDFQNTIMSPSNLNSGLSGTVKDTLDFLSLYGINTSSIRLEVQPTDNPLVYKGMIKFAVGDLTRENPSGVFLEDTGKDEKLSFMPEISDLKSIKKGDYLQKSKSTMESSKKKHGGFSKTYGGGAYLESEIYYDLQDKEWKMILLNSDVYLGAGGTYSMVVNSWVGPVPVTAEFITGFTAQVGRKNIVYDYYWDEEENAYYSTRDYITELRPYFYVYGFGGLGADYKVASLKLGPYGQIDLDQQYLWLNGISGEKNGQRLTIAGETGIKFTCKIAFVKYSKKIKIAEASKTWKFNKFDEISKLYTSKTGKSMLMRYAEDDENYYYMEIEPLDETVKFEDRSYLENYNRSWYNSLRRMTSTGENMTILQTNAYPYSNPVFTDDGMIMAYLSDSNSTNINDTAVYFTRKSGEYYSPGNEINPSEYGDMDLVIDGTEEGAVLAWTRVMDKIEDAGEEATDEDIYNILGKAEIMVSSYDGDIITTYQLTENYSADMMPVVATNGEKSIVAWRNLESSIDNPLDFSSKDNIMYSVLEGDKWSEAKVLYEGTVDKVGALNVDMLSNGISAITYEIAIGETGNTEVFYAILDEEGNILKNIRLTNNELKDENPQITSVEFPDSEQRFIIGWNTENIADGYSENIIKIVAINSNGTLYPDFEIVAEDTVDLGNYTNFKFTKGADDLEDLSIIWSEIDKSYEDINTLYKDSIWGRKIIFDGANHILTPKIKLLEMEDNHTVDFSNAYIDEASEEINFGLLISDNTDMEKPKAKLAIAKASYKNSAILEEVYFSLEDVLPNIDMPIRFTLYNEGIEPITEVNINIGDQNYKIEEEIKPGEYKRIVVLYTVPEVIENPKYKVLSNFSTSSDIKEGTLKIAIPDVEIYDIKTIKEKDRERVLSLMLKNSSPVDLVAGKHSISIEVYTSHDFDTMPILTETITSSKDLDTINNGIYVKDIILDEEILELILDKDGEIPTDGYRVFFNVVLYEDNKPVDDRDIYNNIDYKKIESLITKNNKVVSLGSFMKSKDNKTTVTVEALNNSMKSINNGNIIVSLKDENGNIIETKQSHSPLKNNSLIEIMGEESSFTVFDFNKVGSSVDVNFQRIQGPIIDPEDPKEPNEPDKPNAPIRPSTPSVPKKPEEPEEPKNPKVDLKFEVINNYKDNFKDISPGDWFYEAVKFVYERGLMIGTSDKDFSPHMETSRGMFLTVLYRIEGEPTVRQSKFTDVTKDKYYANAVAWGEANGIVKGMNEMEFGPNKSITREQFVLILYRYVQYKGYPINKVDISNYDDSLEISDYALEAMEWAVREGLIKGRSESRIEPQGNTTRAEMATILQRFIEQVLLKYN
ncbi:S-layer homology domain-containing protein [Tissierella sp.]|uniref:S-layer homology domain-containing protein n=1 Tax=Tissierella sp. TaxID=41274 RepID=UPI002858C491|nr:S-layer homology domain-containing protein [Tissierella sp.]MDR7857567.1 S-layer homology domain-containing protein [Tissierella sp.]